MTTPPDPIPAPVTDPPEPDPAPADPPAPPATDWKAESRKWETRAKKNDKAAEKLAEIEAASLSELERERARATAAEEKAAAAAENIAVARLEAALTGLVDDPAEEVADLNVSKFLGEDGLVDPAKLAALKKRYADRVPPGTRAPRPNPAQGNGTPAKTLPELIAELERKKGKTQAEMRELMKLKARQMKATQG